MIESKEIAIVFTLAVVIVGAITVLMHEKHYDSRRTRMLESRVKCLEEIIGETRGS